MLRLWSINPKYNCDDIEVSEVIDDWNRRHDKNQETIAQQAERINELEGALKQAQIALEVCYDVVDYPCDGSTRQDEAIKLAVEILAKGGE